MTHCLWLRNWPLHLECSRPHQPEIKRGGGEVGSLNILRFSQESLFQLELSASGGESLGPKEEDVRGSLEVTAQGWAVKGKNGVLVLAPESQAWALQSLRVKASSTGLHRERFTHPNLWPGVSVKVPRVGKMSGGQEESGDTHVDSALALNSSVTLALFLVLSGPRSLS